MKRINYHKEKYSFRIVMLSSAQSEDFKKRFHDLKFTLNEHYLNKRYKVITLPITKRIPVSRLLRFIADHEIARSKYDLFISLVTERNIDFISVPKTVLNFLSTVCCSFGFSVTYVGLAKRNRNYHSIKRDQKEFYFLFNEVDSLGQVQFSNSNVPVKTYKRNNKYEIKINLTKQTNCKHLVDFISQSNLNKGKHRLVVCFKTPYDSHGLRIPEYVFKCYKEIGGEINFVYQCI